MFYSEGGSLKSAKVTAAAGNKVTLERAVPLQAGDTWVLSGKVKPRLYRAIGIKENTDAGTYTVTALLHDPKKYAAVDSFAHFDHEITTLHNTAPVLTDAAVNIDGGTVVMTWDNLAANGQVLTYDIKIYRNNSLYRHIPDAQTAEIRLENLPNGNYRAEIRGRNARGVLSAPLVKAWSIDYAVTGLRTTPKTLSVAVDWVLPQTVVSELVSELWYSKTNNLQTAAKLASLAYPQNSYTLTGVGVADVYYFWVRIRDIAGNTGEFTAAVQGRADNNPAPIVQQIQGAIGKSALSRELIDTLNRDMAAAAGLKVSAEAAERAKALQEEARARTAAIQAESSARTAAIQAESSARTAELARKSSEIGTRIAATEAVNEQQAQQIQTVTSAQGNTAAGLEAEKKARTDGDRAEAQARETLAVRLGNAESGISALRETVTRQDAARSSEINTLTAKLESVEVGGRNYALSTAAADKILTVSGNNQTKSVTLDVSSSLDLKQGDALIIACDLDIVNATSMFGKPYPRIGVELSVTYSDNTIGYFSAWYDEAVKDAPKTLKRRLVAKHTVAKDVKAVRGLIVQARYQTSDSIKVSGVKLERGTVATDWSPAPEDSNADASALSALSAELTAYKAAQVETDKAQTEEIRAAKAVASGNQAEITRLQTAKAEKDEVATIARNALSAEWKRDADNAKTAAVAAAVADAKVKADAAQAAAERAAQAKADAAQAAAAADAKTKSDAAKAAAIADAAAKDAQIKREAAADAKAKADKALADAKSYSDTASAKIDRLAETVSRNDAARSSEINTLTAKLESVEVGGRNYALSTAAADKILTVSGNNQTKSVTLDVSSSLDLKQGDALIIACDLDIVNATSMFGKPYPRIGVELSVTYSDNTIGYFSAWYDEAVKDAPKTLKRRLVAKHTVAKDVKAVRGLIVQARYQTSDSIKVSGVKLERGTVATDWSPAPEDSNADTSALTALSAKVQQASSAVAEIGGKVQSLYTLKTEAIAGGRRAVAGVAVGADGKTGSGEILLMADKVAYVDPKDKTVTPAFVTVIENGRAKQALNGDLFASGSVLAKHLAANLTVEAPTLNGATVNAGLINGGTIRGARIEAVDLEAANIIGDVVAVRTFELKQSPLGYQELICQIPDSRKARRTVIVPPVFAVAENGAVVSLQLYMDGVIQREVTIQSPEKRIERNEKFSVWVPGGPPLYMRTPQDVPLSFSVPFHLPKIGSISFQKGIDGAAHSLHILCRISGNFDYSPLGDLSGIVCLIV